MEAAPADALETAASDRFHPKDELITTE